MQSCWFEDPEARPGFTSLRNKLEEMMEENVCYMEFDSEKQQCYYYSSSSSSDDESSNEGLDTVAEESPMLVSVETDHLLITPMLKIPSGGGLQSRSTQNLSQASPRKRVSSVSLSMSSLNQSSQSPREGVPSDSITFARNIDNHLYYAGHMTAPSAVIPCAVSQEASENGSNPYSGVIGSLENVQYRGIPIVAQLDLCCPHTENPQLCKVSIHRVHSSSSKNSNEGTQSNDHDSCLGEENSSEDENQCGRELQMSDTFGSSDLSQDGSQSNSYSPLVDFESGSSGSLLISPMSMDSGVSCDLATSKLVFDVCEGGESSAVRDTAL